MASFTRASCDCCVYCYAEQATISTCLVRFSTEFWEIPLLQESLLHAYQKIQPVTITQAKGEKPLAQREICFAFV